MSTKPKNGTSGACSEASGSTQHATRDTDQASGGRHHLLRYLGIYFALWKNSVTREMIFKSNFLLWIVVELLWFGLQLTFIGVLYLHTEHIGTWTKWQVVMLIGGGRFFLTNFSSFFFLPCPDPFLPSSSSEDHLFLFSPACNAG